METKKKRGGIRKGSGRPKATHTIQSENMRKFVIDEISKKMSPILQAQIDAAIGISVSVKDKVTGKIVKTYLKAPDTTVGQYLLNQVIGKPKETLDLNTPNVPVDPEKKEKSNAILLQFLGNISK